ncbi:hypothetical protein ACLOAV_000597 [Pseudogymnoascus australis]
MEQNQNIPRHKMMLRPRNLPLNAKRQRLNARLILTKGEDLKAYDGIRNGFQAAGAVPEIPDSEDDPDDMLSVNASQVAEASHSYPLPPRPPKPTDVDEDSDEDSLIEDGGDGSLLDVDREVSLTDNKEVSLCENEGDVSFSGAKAVAEYNAGALSAHHPTQKVSDIEYEASAYAPDVASECDSNEAPESNSEESSEYDSDEGLAHATDEEPEYDLDEDLSHFSTAGDDEDKILRLLDEDEDEYQGMLRGTQDDIIEGPDDESLGDASADSSEDLGAIYSELDTYKSFPGALVQVPYVEADVQRFWARFDNIFQGLKGFACGIKYDKTQEKPTYPLSFSFWSILRNIPTEEFMVVYKAAIPQKVQLVLGREVLTPEEILLLDKDWLHHKNGGVYVDLAYTKSRPNPCGNGACVMKVSCRYNSTLCYICSVYKGHNDRLPTRSEIEALMSMKQKQAAIRAMAGPDPRCGDCTRPESMFDENHYTHRTVPGILFCAICWLRIQKIGRRRAPEEATKSLKRIALMTRRKNGETITCENCSVSDNVMTGRRKPHYHYMKTDQVLCEPCTKYHRAHGQHRDPNSESNRDFRKGIREKRMRGIKLYCAECDKLEVTDKRKFYCKNSTLLCQTCYRASKDRGVLWKNASTAKWRKGREVVKCENCSVVESLGVGQRPRHTYVTMSRGISVNKLLCRSCSLYFDRNGKHRDPTAELLRDFKTAIKDKRGKGVPLHCTGCNKVEGGSKRNFTCADVDTLLCGTCYGKRPKKEGAAKKSNT